MLSLWIVAVVALGVALVALMQARRTARQLAQITEMYWQLKFDHGELKAKVAPATPAAPEPKATFVPLTRLRSDSSPSSGGAGASGASAPDA